MKTALAGVIFGVFLGLSLLVTLRRLRSGSGPMLQRLVSRFLLFAVAIDVTAVVTRHDLWPFSSWALMVGAAPQEIGDDPQSLVVVMVDVGGKEHEVDYRAWQPFGVEELHAWLRTRFLPLSDEGRDRVAAYLLSLANAGRGNVRSGKRPGYFDRFLGRLAAPSHQLHPAIWNRPDDVPPEPFVGLRFYREYWNLEARRRDPTQMRRVMVYQYSAPE